MQGQKRYWGLLIAVMLVLLSLPTIGAADEAADRPDPIKTARLDWRLGVLNQQAQARGAGSIDLVAAEMGLSVVDGFTPVQVHGPSSEVAAAAIIEVGGTVDARWGDIAQGWVPVTNLGALDADTRLFWVAPPTRLHEEAVTGQGIEYIGADDWHTAGWDGTGVTVAIMDSGFTGYEASQASGDLPPVVDIFDRCDGQFATRSTHGTAVAEIVHEVAPGASLVLMCTDDTGHWTDAIAYAADKGASILQVSLGTFNTGRGDGTGGMAPHVAQATAAGILWINSAGNYRENHWSDTYVDNGSGSHDFNAGDWTLGFSLAKGSTVTIYAKWDDWPTSDCDYNIYLYDHTNVLMMNGAYPWGSWNEQAGVLGDYPEESFQYTNPSSTEPVILGLEVENFLCLAETPQIDVFILGATNLQYWDEAGSITGVVPNAEVTAVGAVNWNTSVAEDFSSMGPTIDSRNKPDLSAPDRVANGTINPFWGTSAAAPHASGAAALLKHAYPAYTRVQLAQALEDHTVDRGPTGPDPWYGVGVIDLGTPPSAPPGLCFGQVPTVTYTPGMILKGTAGPDVLLGGDGNDTIQGKGGDDLICGGGGNDKINGGDGDDQIDGGDGKDQAVYFAATQGVWVSLSAGTATGQGNDTLMNIENIMGSKDYNDTLIGNNRSNMLKGLGGKDKLYGGGNIDNLQGQAGNDTLYGEDGNDKLYGKAGFDKIYGGDGDDILQGNLGDDTLDGGAGTDDLDGGAGGNDTCINGGGVINRCEILS